MALNMSTPTPIIIVIIIVIVFLSKLCLWTLLKYFRPRTSRNSFFVSSRRTLWLQRCPAVTTRATARNCNILVACLAEVCGMFGLILRSVSVVGFYKNRGFGSELDDVYTFSFKEC